VVVKRGRIKKNQEEKNITDKGKRAIEVSANKPQNHLARFDTKCEEFTDALVTHNSEEMSVTELQ
jgi:hypothetical protein